MPTSGPRALRRAATLIGVILIGGSCRSPSEIVIPPLEMVVAGGDSQYGTVGQTLQTPLRVQVRTLSGRVGHEGASVIWEVVSGSASVSGVGTSITDMTGSAEMQVTLGSTIGEVVVRATVDVANRPSTTFMLFVVDRPTVASVVPTSAAPGDTITITGTNFSPVAEQNVVLFSGVRGEAVSSSGTQLTAVVPSCLPARGVSVSVQLGAIGSGTLPLTVTVPGSTVALAVGEVIDVSDDAGLTCLGLPGGGQYLVLPFSASTVGAATHPFSLTGLSSAAPTRSFGSVRPGEGAGAEPLHDPQGRLDDYLRGVEERLVESAAGAPGIEMSSTPARVPPSLGERRSFNVFESLSSFAQVDAEARYVGEEVAIFVDDDAPSGGLSNADLQAFAERFNQVIYPEVTAAFGNESDIDANERVIVLFTPVVNALTPRGSNGFVGGFFFGLDLMPTQSNSNDAEIFYALVPDPSGQYSDARSVAAVLDVVPAILAHEFQHMVHFNERVLIRDADSPEALWLSEGVAQYAEELVARVYEGAGDPISAELFRSGNRTRARRYLARPDTISLIISTGQGTLEERGGGLLFTMYIHDLLGGDLLSRLTRTTRTGVANVEAETGLGWETLLADWWSAMWLDGPSPEPGPLAYPTVDLAGFLGTPFPLIPLSLGGGDFQENGSLWSSAARYYIVTPPASGMTSVRLGGEAGGNSSGHARLRMRIVRIS